MKFLIHPLAIGDDDGFKDDLFERKSFGSSLRNLVNNAGGGLVISINADWGEGKTTFVKKWRGQLREENIWSIYIDAFANDYGDDAFMSVTGAVTEFATSHVPLDKVKDFKKKASSAAIKVLSWSAGIAIKAATLGVINASDMEALGDVKGDVSSRLSSIMGKAIEDRLTSHSEDLESLETFRQTLSSLPAVIKGNDGKPLVVIVDELDRCRPTYAVEVLEKVKHLFSVENVVFVLVMNKQQLEKSIKCVYGDIDAHSYLQKFIHVETTLPKRDGRRNTSDIEKYCDHLMTQHEIKLKGPFREIVQMFGVHFNLTLRQLERVFSNLVLLYSAESQHGEGIPQINVFVCVIKVVRPEDFARLRIGNLSIDEIRDGTRLPIGQQSESSSESSLDICRRMMMPIAYSLMAEDEWRKVGMDRDGYGFFSKAMIACGAENTEFMPEAIRRLDLFGDSS